jgi:hypothetical protein
MTSIRILALSAAAALAAAPGIARAAEPPCLTRAEFSALASYALPSAIGGASARCAPALGPTAYLPTRGGELSARYGSRKNANWPAAKSAFLKLSAETNSRANSLIRQLPDDSLREMLDLMVEGLVSQEIPPEKCGTIDELVRLLAPLPPENAAALIAPLIILIGDSRNSGPGVAGKLGELAICEERS